MLFKVDKKLKGHGAGYQIFYINREKYTVTSLDRTQTFSMYEWHNFKFPYFINLAKTRDSIINNKENMVIVCLYVRHKNIMTGVDKNGRRCGISKEAMFDEIVYDPLIYDCNGMLYKQLLSLTESTKIHNFYEKYKKRNLKYLNKNTLLKFGNAVTESDQHFSNFICYVDRLQPYASKYQFFVKLLFILGNQGHLRILKYKRDFLKSECQEVFKTVERKVLKAKIPLQC